MCILKYLDSSLINMTRNNCTVPGCKNSREKSKVEQRSVIFHRFPREPMRRADWLIKCQLYETVDPNLAVVCSDHFMKSDYFVSFRHGKHGIKTKKLKSSAVPSRKLPQDLHYIKKQEAIHLVIEADPVPLMENDNDVLSFTDPDNVLLSDLKMEASLSSVRSPLTVKNDIISIHYDHSYAIPFSDDLLHKKMSSVNKTLNGKRQFKNCKYKNDVGTMTEMLGTDCERLDEFEREIRWLWQRNKKMQNGISLLKARNRELVSKNLRTQKELNQNRQKFDELKKKLSVFKQKYPDSHCKSE